MKPSTYWSERIDASDAARREQMLEIARNMVVAGIEMAFQTSGSGLQAIEEVETAVSGWLAAHNAVLAAEVEAIETQGSA
ncbi:hypothetical protein MesoLj131c_47110 [Mesorhizobium sp. 131-3-5]|uniref:hypothetical protein n=1 Tax=Mesorhizobium sp. 131-3-5 TaxID=2744520 RepID=UPI001927BFC7|nr:hypothetical protein [Mesorhizobium sp. 131-3-5]BCH10453.1 hypothetical protein MesoLj131c_47110 [Mesorhizobium sp. 131-3-5]